MLNRNVTGRAGVTRVAISMIPVRQHGTTAGLRLVRVLRACFVCLTRMGTSGFVSIGPLSRSVFTCQPQSREKKQESSVHPSVQGQEPIVLAKELAHPVFRSTPPPVHSSSEPFLLHELVLPIRNREETKSDGRVRVMKFQRPCGNPLTFPSCQVPDPGNHPVRSETQMIRSHRSPTNVQMIALLTHPTENVSFVTLCRTTDLKDREKFKPSHINPPGQNISIHQHR